MMPLLSTGRMNILGASASRCFLYIGNDLCFLRDIQGIARLLLYSRGINISWSNHRSKRIYVTRLSFFLLSIKYYVIQLTKEFMSLYERRDQLKKKVCY